MQTLGAEWGRDLIAPDLLTMAWRQAAKAALASGAPGIVAEDCRYENEAVAIRALGGVVVRIIRPTALPQVGAHATEAQAFRADATIHNDGPVEILTARLEGILDRYERRTGAA